MKGTSYPASHGLAFSRTRFSWRKRVIARAEADTMDELGSVVVNAIGNVPGVERTLLCPIVNL